LEKGISNKTRNNKKTRDVRFFENERNKRGHVF
jgi:hypothetical protein